MSVQEPTRKQLESFMEFDTLSTDDQKLIELARSIVSMVEAGKAKIVDLNNLTANRYIRVMMLPASEKATNLSNS